VAKYNGGGGSPTLGKPKVAATATISASDIAYAPNGDEAVVASTGLHVFLIAGANEANEYNIATSGTATALVHGTLVKGDAYLLAGTGTRKIVADPGTFATTNPNGSSYFTASRNSISATSVAFDSHSNVVIAEKNIGTGQAASAVQIVAKTACESSCPYRLTTTVVGGLYTVADQGLLTAPHTAIGFSSGVFGNGLVVDSQGNIIESTDGSVFFLNEGSSSVTRYGKKLPAHAATTITGTPSRQLPVWRSTPTTTST
jgi:hypothetical protein